MGKNIFDHTVVWTGRALLSALMAVLFLAGLAASASAQVNPQPSRLQVSATRGATVRVTYRLTNPFVEPVPVIVTADDGLLTFSGQGGSGAIPIVGVLTTVLPTPDSTGVLSETVNIPHAFILQALQAGARTMFITRPFIFNQSGQTISEEVQVPVDITGSLGAPLTVSRLDLRFYNNAVQIIVPQHEPPEVRADISYSGTGLFRAVWELADPRTTVGGTAIFRILRQDRVRLPVGGFTSVKGPRLSAELTGPHIVRFRVLDGPLAGQNPVVRYFVKAADPGTEWWKRYLQPHEPDTGFIRMPEETEPPGGMAGEDEAATEGEPGAGNDGIGVSEEEAPEAAGPEDETPGDLAPEEEAPEATAPEDESPEDEASEDEASEDEASEDETPEDENGEAEGEAAPPPNP